LAIGDALAIALLEAKGFSKDDFQVFHPGGKLGAQLRRVSELMHLGEQVPLVAAKASMSETVAMMSAKGFGMTGVLDETGSLAGVVTDGDLRRHMGDGLLKLSASDVMSKSPKRIRPDALAAAALELMEEHKITALFVVDAVGKPEGLLHLHDLLRAGVA
jgi:arabinose-5-phosphate isomerase